MEKAFEHLTTFAKAVERDVRFHISSGNKLGIYLRQPKDVTTPSVHAVNVEPVFLDDKRIGELTNNSTDDYLFFYRRPEKESRLRDELQPRLR